MYSTESSYLCHVLIRVFKQSIYGLYCNLLLSSLSKFALLCSLTATVPEGDEGAAAIAASEEKEEEETFELIDPNEVPSVEEAERQLDKVQREVDRRKEEEEKKEGEDDPDGAGGGLL